MGIWNSVKNAVNNFYGGNGNQDDYEADEEQNINDSEEVDDNPGGYGSDDENPSEYGDEDETGDKEDVEGEESEEEERKVTFSDRARGAFMRKEAIVHGCSPRAEPVPCPVCHQKSVYKSLRTFDWFPLLIGARMAGVPLYRFYCFNNRCSKSWYKGFVFNCPTEKFTPVSAPTKRQFNAS